MSKLITDAQKHEIEELAVEHSEALIAYGADMHSRGMFKGFVVGVVGVLIGYTIGEGIELLVKRRK